MKARLVRSLFKIARDVENAPIHGGSFRARRSFLRGELMRERARRECWIQFLGLTLNRQLLKAILRKLLGIKAL
jgi:hypothetical protein